MRMVYNEPPWPHVFELDVDEEYTFVRGGREWVISLSDVTHWYEPDRYIDGSGGETISEARVDVTVNGERKTLRARPFAWPIEVDGLRLYVETTSTWATGGGPPNVPDVSGDVRLSAAPAGEPWGPPDVAFPVGDYRWRANSYANTWSALVPYNKLYYHRGEDFGAIPDRLPVRSPLEGTVTKSPLPDGDGASNAIVIEGDAMAVRLAHANVETVTVEEGDWVEAGEAIARTGCTWDGRQSQTHDPHLHVEFQAAGTRLSPYPTLVEAYLRDYPDVLVPVGGGYYFALSGDEVTLDGSRSLARPGREVVDYRWHHHDGTVCTGATTTLSYDEPGLYTEELRVKADDGSTARDYAQVRVYQPDEEDPAPYGWVYHHPHRGVLPGHVVTFWNRLRYDGPVVVSFGDGESTTLDDGKCTHAYDAPGTYTVTFDGTVPGHEPVMAKIPVTVAER